jgi:beta propeller repeat protein
VTGDGRTDGVVLTRVTKSTSKVTTLRSRGTTCKARVSWAGKMVFSRSRVACAPGESVIVPKTTKRLSAGSLDAFASVSPDGITYTFSHPTPQLAALQVGDVIVAPPGPGVPEGIFRKIDAIDPTHLVFTTSQASLVDAIDSGQVSFTRTITAGDVGAKLYGPPGVSIVRSPKGTFSLDPITVKIDDVSLGGVTLDGTISVTQSFYFDINLGFISLDGLTFTETTATHADLDTTVTGTVSDDAEQELASWPLATFVIWVAGFPIWFEPELSIYVGADGSVSAGVKTGVTQDTSTTLGLTYDGDKFAPVLDQSATRSYDEPELFGSGWIKGYAGAELMVKVESLAGPYIAGELFAGIWADTLANPWWSLKCGIDAKVGAKVEIFDETLADWSHDENLATWTLATAGGPYTPRGAVSGKVIDADTHVGVAGAHVTIRASDGSGDVVKTTTSGADGSYMISGLAVDTFPAEAQADGYGVGRRNVTVSNGIITPDQDIELPAIAASPAFVICDRTGEDGLPAVSGDTVVWEEYVNHQYDLRARNVVTTAEYVVASTPDFEVSPDIDDNTVVYVRVENNSSNIWATDLDTMTSYPICRAAGSQTDPHISGRYIVWWDGRDAGHYDIWAHDLVTDKNFIVCDDPGDQIGCVIDGNLVAWLDTRTTNDQIYAKRLPNGAEFLVRGTNFVQFPDVSGDRIVWWESSGSNQVIRGRNVVTNELFTVFDGGTIYGYGPTIEGDIVTWLDDRAVSGSSDIWAKNLRTGVEFPVCVAPYFQGDTAMSGNLVVWTDNRNEHPGGDIWGCRLE